MGSGNATFGVSMFICSYNVVGVLGAIGADLRWGRYSTQVVTSVLWSLGSAGLLACTIAQLSGASMGYKLALTFAGIGLTAAGMGAQQPSQAAFVGDQVRASRAAAFVVERNVLGADASLYVAGDFVGGCGLLLCLVLLLPQLWLAAWRIGVPDLEAARRPRHHIRHRHGGSVDCVFGVDVGSRGVRAPGPEGCRPRGQFVRLRRGRRSVQQARLGRPAQRAEECVAPAQPAWRPK